MSAMSMPADTPDDVAKVSAVDVAYSALVIPFAKRSASMFCTVTLPR